MEKTQILNQIKKDYSNKQIRKAIYIIGVESLCYCSNIYTYEVPDFIDLMELSELAEIRNVLLSL